MRSSVLGLIFMGLLTVWLGLSLGAAGQPPLAEPLTGAEDIVPRPTVGAVALVQATSARSPRNANYSIDVQLDAATRTLTGRGVLTWRNISSISTSELQFHLYYNAWKNTRSTWMREEAARRQRRPPLAARSGLGLDRGLLSTTARRRRRPADRADEPHALHLAGWQPGRSDSAGRAVPSGGRSGRNRQRPVRMDLESPPHLLADRRHRQLLLPRAVVPQGRRSRRHRLELP